MQETQLFREATVGGIILICLCFKGKHNSGGGVEGQNMDFFVPRT